MSNTKTILLADVKRAVVSITGITQDNYNLLMYNTGLQFAEQFARLTHDPLDVYEAMVRKPKDNADRNYFWDWWVFKWFLNDQRWYQDKVYQQPLRYEHYKSYMVNDEQLTDELLEDYFAGKI